MHATISAEIINYMWHHTCTCTPLSQFHFLVYILASSLHQMHFLHAHNAAQHEAQTNSCTIQMIFIALIALHSHFVDWCMYTIGAAAVRQSFTGAEGVSVCTDKALAAVQLVDCSTFCHVGYSRILGSSSNTWLLRAESGRGAGEERLAAWTAITAR